jgi:hypothetical protein
MLFEESGIDPGVAEERGYHTVTRRSELLDFGKKQRRASADAPALRVPLYSPDGITRLSQLRPHKPRVPGLKYETPAGTELIIDVHPRMRDRVRRGGEPLLITEGAKTGDAATSRGAPTVVLAGVWGWCVKGVRPYRLRPCFDHVRLEGREVNIAFDSDCMTKEGVQRALEALARCLEERGAVVKVIYLPDAADGSKQGIDDYLVGGGTIKEMFMLARTFEPADIGRIRLSRDQKLRAGVEDLERRWWREEWKGRGGHTDRDVALKLIEAATRRGEIHADGIRVKASWGVLQVGAKVARKTLARAFASLEERGFLYRDNGDRKADKTGAFVLRAKVDQGRERATQATPELRAYPTGGLPLRAKLRSPRLMWSRPKFTPKRGTVTGTRRVRESKPLEPRDRIERLGKIRGAILDALDAAGGSCTLQEIADALHRKRPRDIRRRNLPWLEEAGILTVEGDTVTLAEDWLDRLEEAREAGGELEAEELAEKDRKRRSRAYREHLAERRRDKPLISKPSPAGLAAVERSREKRAEHIAEHDEHQAAARAADLEHKRFVKRFVHDRMRALGRIRLELLRQILRDAGGTPSYALPAAKSLGCAVERLPEYENREFVFAPREWGEGADTVSAPRARGGVGA